ncbi:exonuclease mut-7 homolog isoform X2 [Lates japonicus]|uniref:Exonuclease mut-7 homolog isoform X2 n=1 Tax=Lates japonicus TaxID=270547 RepID=A0AAD3MJS5_LATJO|nr:exonuclease mut-7 homolog isoform X2 [Lates japonicus]
MLENTDDHRVAAKLAHAEGRVTLTCGQPFQSLRSQVGEGRCLSLDCSEKARDQAVRVLKHFNVQPTLSDIFSRCQACNSDQYVAVPREDMDRMLKQKGFLQDQDNTDHAQQRSHRQEEEKRDDILTPCATPELPRAQRRAETHTDRTEDTDRGHTVDFYRFRRYGPVHLSQTPLAT